MTESIDLENTATGLGFGPYLSLLLSSAVADAVLPIFYIFIPIFAVKLGANALQLGLVGGVSYGVYSFMPFVMGHFSDRAGARKFFIVASFGLLCVVSFLYSIVANPTSLILIRIFEGIGWAMLWPAMEASITEDSFRDSKKSLSVFNFTWSGGAALGPGVGTFLVSFYSYRFAFFTSALMFVAIIVLSFVILFRHGSESISNRGKLSMREEESQFLDGSFTTHRSLVSSIRELLFSSDKKRNYRVWMCLVTTALSALTSAVFFTFFGPYATTLGLTVILIGAITTTYGVVRFLSYVIFAKQAIRERVFDPAKRNRNIVIFAGVACLPSLLILTIRDPSGATYFVAFGLFALGYSMVYAISQLTLIAETPHHQMGAGAGLFECSIGLGGFLGPIVSGAISSNNSLHISFIVPVVALFCALVLLFVLSFLQRN